MHNMSDNVYSHAQSAFYLRGDDSGRNIADIGELQQSSSNVFHHVDALYLPRISSMYNGGTKASNTPVLSSNLQFGGLNNSLCPTQIGSSGGGQELLQKGGIMAFEIGSGGGGGAATSVKGHLDNWADSGVAAHHSHQTGTCINLDDKNQFPGIDHHKLIVTDSIDQCKEPVRDQKLLSKLALNREAAKKCRLRKKAYVQQLESSSQRLTKLEHDLKKASHKGFSRSGFCRDQSQSYGSCVAFDVEYTNWLEEHQRLITDLRLSVNYHLCDTELQLVVEAVMSHYDELFRLKGSAAKSDIFHILSGIWKTPAERCFMWLGGFRCSDVLKVLGKQIEPLTEQQLAGICDLQKSSQQAEDALSQGMEALQQSVFETLSNNSVAPYNGGNMVDYMGQMAMAMSKIATVENFLHQAELLRLQTLQQLRRILTTRQAAHALLAINDYKSRIRALSSLWLARPNV